MLWSNWEYIPLRLLRRFLVTDRFLAKFGRLLPYYQYSQNQLDPRPIVDLYEKYLQGQSLVMAGKSILEVGAGATNSTGYELSARFPESDILLWEPIVEFDAVADQKFRPASALSPEDRRLRRLRDSGALKEQSIDLILSHSVLEHVAQPRAFFQELKRILKPDGLMLHIADYRDHFFKYPYHFLQFSQTTWNRYLNPGDLPGWRLGEHLQIIRGLDLHVEILAEQREAAAFAQIRPHISPDYDRDDPYLDVTLAVLAVTRPPA